MLSLTPNFFCECFFAELFIVSYTFFGFAVINMIALTLVYFFAPETMGKSLEQIEEMFHKRGEAK